MRKHQLKLEWSLDPSSGRFVAHNASGPEADFDVYKLSNLVAELPVGIVHGRTVWIIHLGHDLSYDASSRTFSSSSPYVANTPLLMEWGPAVQLRCGDGHAVHDSAKFCHICGRAIEGFARSGS